MHVERRTEFVDVLPLEDFKTLLSLVKIGQPVSAREVGLAWNNAESYAMGQFLPSDHVMFHAATAAGPAATCTKEECVAALEAVVASAEPKKGMQAGRIDWKNLISTILPFILKLLI